MAEITEAQVLDALKTIGHNGKDLVSAGMISGVAIKSGAVQAALEIDPKLASEMAPIQKAAEAAIRGIPGVLSATVILTAESAPPSVLEAARGPSPPGAGAAGFGALSAVNMTVAERTPGMPRMAASAAF